MAATSTTAQPVRLPDHPVETEHRVTPLELFFDLVFVFAITQVTALMAADPTPRGVGQGLLVLAAIWWAWVGYAWLTNVTDPAETRVRLPMFAAMAAMLVVGLAAPGAFSDDGLLFALALFAVRAVHVALFAVAPNAVDLRGAIARFAPVALTGSLLLVGASFVDGTAQAGMWCLALAIDYGSVLGRGGRGWRVHPGHFAERHALIFIIALGEAIVATGIGAEDVGLGAGVVAAAVLGVVVAAALWWTYFDVVAVVAERVLHERIGEARSHMARDSYSYLHLPMIVGAVLVALGLKKTLGHVDEPLKAVPAVALCGGAALYLLAHVAFRLRNVGSLNRGRIVAALACLALIPAAVSVPALAALAALAAVLVLLVAYEALRFREARARVRSAA